MLSAESPGVFVLELLIYINLSPLNDIFGGEFLKY